MNVQDNNFDGNGIKWDFLFLQKNKSQVFIQNSIEENPPWKKS
jgi:hypothetical protein